MSENPLTELVMVAANLKGAAPQFFAQLVEAIRLLEVQSITEMVAADRSEELFRQQGRVKTIQQIRRHLQECQQLRDQYTRRSTNARPVAQSSADPGWPARQ